MVLYCILEDLNLHQLCCANLRSCKSNHFKMGCKTHMEGQCCTEMCYDNINAICLSLTWKGEKWGKLCASYWSVIEVHFICIWWFLISVNSILAGYFQYYTHNYMCHVNNFLFFNNCLFVGVSMCVCYTGKCIIGSS
jgi:hypothetical protein